MGEIFEITKEEREKLTQAIKLLCTFSDVITTRYVKHFGIWSYGDQVAHIHEEAVETLKAIKQNRKLSAIHESIDILFATFTLLNLMNVDYEELTSISNDVINKLLKRVNKLRVD